MSDVETSVENSSVVQKLAATKSELLRTQERLHQLQESSVAEAAFVQLRGQYLQMQYELWVMKACVAWMKGDRLRLTHCLEASLDCTNLEPSELVADWLKRLDQFSENTRAGLDMDLEELLLSAEWRVFTNRMVAL